MEPAGIKWAAAGIKWEAAGEINLAPTELQLSKFLMLPAMGKAKAGINPRTPRTMRRASLSLEMQNESKSLLVNHELPNGWQQSETACRTIL